MPITRRGGFTLPEVMVVSLLLTAGVGAISGTMARAGRTVHRARQSVRQLEAGIAQVEALRARSASAPAYCDALADGADSLPDGTVRRWRVTPSGRTRVVSVVVSVPVAGGRATDSLATAIWCPM